MVEGSHSNKKSGQLVIENTAAAVKRDSEDVGKETGIVRIPFD